jgi:pyridoxal 5'-phosphate synthase pdxT subunit
MTIGVLALQGDFDAHRRRLEELGAEVVLVRKPEQLDHIDGLVIPGGESGTFLKLLGKAGFEKLKQFVRLKPTFGTCAGAILLATEVENPKQAGLGAIDIGIRRNAYGRQIDSSIREGQFIPEKLAGSPLEMVFIRAPKIERVGPGPRWRLESQPRRRPWPHSAANTTRSRVWLRLTLSHSALRLPGT